VPTPTPPKLYRVTCRWPGHNDDGTDKVTVRYFRTRHGAVGAAYRIKKGQKAYGGWLLKEPPTDTSDPAYSTYWFTPPCKDITIDASYPVEFPADNGPAPRYVLTEEKDYFVKEISSGTKS
jgi:hypothetical protein